MGTRTGRADPRTTMLLSRTFWSMYRRWVHREIPAGGVDIFGCTRQVAGELVKLGESRSSLVGLLYWLGFRRVEVPYQRLARPAGRSGWSLRRKMAYFLDSVFSFTDVPVTLLVLVGAVGGVLTIVASSVVLVARLTGAIDQTGYTPLMLVMLLSTFAVLFGLGIVGSVRVANVREQQGPAGAVAMTHESFEGEGRL